jgi:hypothetical protein
LRRSIVRALTLVVAIWGGASSVFACRAPGFEKSIFFEEAPFHLQTPVIAEVTITQLLPSRAQSAFANERDDNYSFVGLARVDKIVAGSVTTSTVRVSVVTPTSCDRAFQIGDRGIIAGTIKLGADGAQEFSAISDSEYARQMQRKIRRKN